MKLSKRLWQVGLNLGRGDVRRAVFSAERIGDPDYSSSVIEVAAHVSWSRSAVQATTEGLRVEVTAEGASAGEAVTAALGEVFHRLNHVDGWVVKRVEIQPDESPSSPARYVKRGMWWLEWPQEAEDLYALALGRVVAAGADLEFAVFRLLECVTAFSRSGERSNRTSISRVCESISVLAKQFLNPSGQEDVRDVVRLTREAARRRNFVVHAQKHSDEAFVPVDHGWQRAYVHSNPQWPLAADQLKIPDDIDSVTQAVLEASRSVEGLRFAVVAEHNARELIALHGENRDDIRAEFGLRTFKDLKEAGALRFAGPASAAELLRTASS